MKKVIFLFALTISVSSVFAQNKLLEGKSKTTTTTTTASGNKTYANLDERVNSITSVLKTDLALSDAQVTQIKAVTVNRINQIEEARKTMGSNEKLFTQARTTIFAGWETDLKGILNATQLASYVSKKEADKVQPVITQ